MNQRIDLIWNNFRRELSCQLTINNMVLYNSIGKGYNYSRKPDKRIVQCLINLLDLPLGSVIADIGAGTGNYSNAVAEKGYQVIAIEPSSTMQNQAVDHPNVRWLSAKAEKIPLPDNYVDSAIIILALHHFSDRLSAIKEIKRIVGNGKIVIFAFEQKKIPSFWLTDYFPYFMRDTKDTFPEIETIADEIRQITQKVVDIIDFPLPKDINDLFAAAGWARPELYLDANVRKGISSFAKMPMEEQEKGIKQLTEDLNNGNWDKKYGELKAQESYDAGYRFLVIGSKIILRKNIL